jgi:beta-glucosidase
MKTSLLSGCLAVLSCTAVFGTPCLPGNLQTFSDLGTMGCEVGAVEFNDFTILPGQTVGTPIDPAQVQIIPGGTASDPMLLFTLNSTASAGQVLESFFRFSASDSFTGASIALASPTVTGDATAAAILDVCPDGAFTGGAPVGCSTSPASLVAFAIDQSSLLSDSATFAMAKSLDVFVDLTIDGGRSGSATLDSATVGFSSVPEPSAGLLAALGVLAFGILRVRRRMFSGKLYTAIRRYSRFYARVARGSRNPGPMLSCMAVFALSISLIPQPAYGQLPWMNTSLSAQARTELLLRAMTLDEKIEQIAVLPAPNTDLPGCEFQALGRHIEGIPRLAIPTFREINGGNGVRGGDCLPEPTATGFPSAPMAAATFNPALNFAWGAIVGQETRNFAHQVLLGPAMNLIRHPYTGRAQEYPSEDPYLAGVTATEQTKGIQSRGTQAMIKHFAANDDEGGLLERWTKAVRVPTRAMHELYLLPFEMAIRDGDAASVMCAYPDVNFHWACENQDLLVRTLRQRWGFDGYVESDRRALHSTVGSILARVSIELDKQPKFYSAANVKAALAAKEITEADIDELLRNRYLKMFEFGYFDNPYNSFLPTDFAAGAAVARQAAEEGIVLLKNAGNFLPLGTNIRSVALIGAQWFAGMASLPPRNGNPAELTTVITPPEFTVSPEQGLRNALAKIGSAATVTYNNGSDIASAVALAQQSDVAILMVGNTPRETRDLTTLSLPVVPALDPPPDPCDPSGDEVCPETPEGPLVTDQEALVPAILAANPNTVVVLKTSGMVLMPWLGNVRALLEAWFPGQDDGDAVANVLFGIISPSGKLPVTFGNTAREAAYATEAQYPGVREDNGQPGGQGVDGTPGVAQLVGHYSEDLQMGYRWYEANNVQPVFPFGFGLSYTTFEYSDLSVAPSVDPMTGHAALTVKYTITNTGSRRGAEASQVYLTLPPAAGEPSKRLVGFQKVDLMPGANQVVNLTIDSSAPNHPLSYFQPDPNGTWADGNWVAPAGSYTVFVGSSSANTPLQATVDLNVMNPPVRLQLVSGTINLPGRVMAVLSVPEPFSLLDLHITNVRFEGAPALATVFSSDGRAMVATFDGNRLMQLADGQNVVVSLAADSVKDGIADTLWVTTTATVMR